MHPERRTLHPRSRIARAATALAEGIEPPPYEPFVTGLIRPDTPEGKEDQQRQQQTNEWAAHFLHRSPNDPTSKGPRRRRRTLAARWEGLFET